MSPKRFIFLGYFSGSALCFLGLLAMSLAFVPMIENIKNVLVMQVPGRTQIDIKTPGIYVGMSQRKELTDDQIRKIPDLDYFLTDEYQDEYFDVIKLPQGAWTRAEEDRIFLFQFIIEEEGKYILEVEYPYGSDLLSFQCILIRVDPGHAGRVLVAGIFIFFVLCGLGIYVLIKTYRWQHSNRKP